MKKIKRTKKCIRCNDGKNCHICGREFTIRNGFSRYMKLTKNGPMHYICERCSE